MPQEKRDKPLLRTMSENPALEWNIRETKDSETDSASTTLAPISHGVNTRLNFAPAIAYRKCQRDNVQDYLVAGVSVEVNTFTDVHLFMGLHQYTLLSNLSCQINACLELIKEDSPDQPVKSVSTDNVPVEFLVTCNSVKVFAFHHSDIYMKPTVLISISHPHMFVVFTPANQKATFSLYSLQVCIPTDKKMNLPLETQVDDTCFDNILFESGPATANQASGILPPFLKAELNGFLSETLDINLVVGRPVTCYADHSKISHLMLSLERFEKAMPNSHDRQASTAYSIEATSLKLKTEQVKAVLQTCSDIRSGVCFQFFITASANIFSDDKIQGDLHLCRFTTSLTHDARDFLLFGPSDLEIRGKIAQEAAGQGQQQGSVFIELGRTSVLFGPEHAKVLQILQKEFKTFIAGNSSVDQDVAEKSLLESAGVEAIGEHFCDDLRLGAFILENSSDNPDIPEPYKVMFNSNSLTWTYPRPRTLTKMLILPMPLTFADNSVGNEVNTISCQLQIWSENRMSWSLYQQFVLEEGSVTHVDLPLFTDRRSCEFSKTWRIQMFSDCDVREEIPCSLLSALRVDSYHSSAMLPNIQVVIRSEHLDVQLQNQLYNQGLQTQGLQQGLSVNNSYPKEQNFLTFNMDSLTTELNIWNSPVQENLLKLVTRARLRIECVDYLYLAKHTILQTSDTVLKLQIQENCVDIFSDLQKLEMVLGPFGIHTLTQSAKLWDQTIDAAADSGHFIPLSQILVANDTCETLLIGQLGTDERMLLESKSLTMYSWRSQKSAHALRICSESHPNFWSDSFYLNTDEAFITLYDGRVVSVHVEKTSATVKTVTLKGCITVVNLLKDHLEVKLSNSETGFSCKTICGSFERPMSFVAKPGDVDLKIKLFGIFSAWSRSICLRNERKNSLIRLPKRDNESCLNLWCSVITSGSQFLVVFSPMYVISSQIPGNLLIQAQCEGQQPEIASNPFNSCCQLDLNHSPENKFSLSFRLTPESEFSSPPVSVSWGIVDQVRKSNENDASFQNVMRDMMQMCQSGISSGHLLPELCDNVDSDQFGSDCKVIFEEVHPTLNTLKIKIQPTHLFVNATDSHLVLKNGDDSWYVNPSSAFHPPTIFDSVRIGILLKDGKEYFGACLVLTEHNSAHLSEKPTRERNLPKTGELTYMMRCDKLGLIMSVCSRIEDGVRLISIRSKFHFINELDVLFRISSVAPLNGPGGCDAVGEDDFGLDIPAGSQTQHLMWSTVDKGENVSQVSVRVGAENSNWSKSLPIPFDTEKRQCFCLHSQELVVPCIMMSYIYEGQVYVYVTKDARPQFKILNGLSADLQFMAAGEPVSWIGRRSYTFHTCKYVEEGYPLVDVANNKTNRFSFCLQASSSKGALL